MLYKSEIGSKAHSLMLRFLLAGSDIPHSRSENMSRSDLFPWTRSHGIRKYTIAVLSVAAALILAQWPILHLEAAPVSLFFCAVMLSAWFGGFGPGFLASALSTLIFYYYFLAPVRSMAPKPDEIPRLIIFAMSGLVVAALSAAQRSAAESLRAARDDLKQTVHELQRTNEALRAESIERQHAEDQLRRSEAYLAEGQKLSHTGSWAWKVATKEIIHWSREQYRLFGLDLDRAPQSLATILQRVHQDDYDRLLEVWNKAIHDRTDYKVDFRVVLPGGAVKHIHAVGHPVFDGSGAVAEFVGTSMDVSERKRAEEERERLRQAQMELTHVSRVNTMGELTASLAHEIRQPITAAMTDANTCLRWLAGDTPNLEEAREAARRVLKDGTRASEIVTRLRMLFKKEATERELVDVNDVIREIIALLRNELARYSISVKARLTTDLPQVLGDRVQLQQVMMNLIMNSVDAMKDTDWTREVAIKSEQGENGQIEVSVSDTGVGLPPEHAGQIFNAFFTTKPNGTGMGLRISRSIVESHGGRLWATDNSLHGTTFCFSLPIEVEAHE
jgi:PAS domain S-box-containing protein